MNAINEKTRENGSKYKTRQDVFLEQWPDAKIRNNGMLDIKPCTVEKSMVCCMDCTQCCQDFWSQKVENDE